MTVALFGTMTLGLELVVYKREWATWLISISPLVLPYFIYLLESLIHLKKRRTILKMTGVFSLLLSIIFFALKEDKTIYISFVETLIPFFCGSALWIIMDSCNRAQAQYAMIRSV